MFKQGNDQLRLRNWSFPEARYGRPLCNTTTNNRNDASKDADFYTIYPSVIDALFFVIKFFFVLINSVLVKLICNKEDCHK